MEEENTARLRLRRPPDDREEYDYDSQCLNSHCLPVAAAGSHTGHSDSDSDSASNSAELQQAVGPGSLLDYKAG